MKNVDKCFANAKDDILKSLVLSTTQAFSSNRFIDHQNSWQLI